MAKLGSSSIAINNSTDDEQLQIINKNNYNHFTPKLGNHTS